jgi:hypothetical protein
MFVLFLYLTIKKNILFPVFLSLFLSFFAHLLVNLYCLRCAIFFFPFIHHSFVLLLPPMSTVLSFLDKGLEITVLLVISFLCSFNQLFLFLFLLQ